MLLLTALLAAEGGLGWELLQAAVGVVTEIVSCHLSFSCPAAQRAVKGTQGEDGLVHHPYPALPESHMSCRSCSSLVVP